LIVAASAGGTDYIALPTRSALGANYVVTFLTDRVGGFEAQEIADMTWIAQRVPNFADHHHLRGIARNVLNAYLGSKIGPRVLAGQIDAQAKAIGNHGGEILKFVGDSLLAIFPIDDSCIMARDAARNALAAASEAVAAVRLLIGDPLMEGEPPLEIVVGLHIGSVIYGNIGADFTVIRPAVNLVNQIETVAKALKAQIVVSDDFARVYERPLRSIGCHKLRGLATPHELFALATSA
jgi:adenylate cyclase